MDREETRDPFETADRLSRAPQEWTDPVAQVMEMLEEVDDQFEEGSVAGETIAEKDGLVEGEQAVSSLITQVHQTGRMTARSRVAEIPIPPPMSQ